MFRKLILSLSVVSFGLMSQAASAALVTFDFTNGSHSFTSGSLNYTGSDGSTTVSASAGNQGNSLTSYISDSPWGLLTCTGSAPSSPKSNASCGRSTNDHHYTDGGRNNGGSDPDEFIALDFGQSVSLVSASFYSSSNGDFDLFADNTKVLNEKGVGNNVLLGGIDASLFHFLADGSGDNFKLKALTVEVSQVPLPAAAWLFASAIIGLGAASRRKRFG